MNQLHKTTFTFTLAILIGAFVGSSKLAAQNYDKLSPFEAIRWTDEGKPEVRVDRTWYAVTAINDVEIEDILEFCKETWPSKVQKRFNEDLVEVLSRMGHPPKKKVALKLTNPETKQAVTLAEVAMTRENRNAIYHATQTQSLIARQISEALTEFDVVPF